MPIVIEIAGSSTVMSGSGTGFSRSASVSPMVISGMPATAMMSPGAGRGAGHPLERLGHQKLGDLDGLLRPVAPSQATFWPLRMVPWWTRHSASRPRNGDASRFVTWAWSGAPSTYSGAGTVSMMVRNSGSRSGASGIVAVGRLLERRPAGLGRRVDDREVERVLVVLVVEQVEEQLVRLLDDLGDPRVGPVDLVDDEDDGELLLERLAKHEAGLRQRALRRVDEQHDAVDHGQPALDLAAEVGVAGGVDDVDRHRLGGRPCRRSAPRCSWRGS